MLHPARRAGSRIAWRAGGILAAAALGFAGLVPIRAAADGQPSQPNDPVGEPQAEVDDARPARAATDKIGGEPDSLAFVIAAAQAEIRQNPRLGSVRIPLAEAYRSRGNLLAARSLAEEGLRLGLSGGDSTRAVTILADIAFKQGRSNEARTLLTALAARGGSSPEILAMLAQLRWDDHQREEAITLGMEAVACDPANVDRLRWVAERWKQLGRPDEALTLRKQILLDSRATDEDLFQVAFLSHQLGDGQSATDAYLKLLARRPTHPQGNYNLSLLMLSLGDTLDATRRLELAIQGDPEMQRAYFDLAVLYLHGGRVADARRVLTLFQAAAGADSLLNAEVEMILDGIANRKDRRSPGR